jgi:hypothetical protein
MSRRFVRFALVLAAAWPISLFSGCIPNTQPNTPNVAPPVAESAPNQCNGQPYWCVKVANQVSDSVQVYLDGQNYTTLGAGKVLWIPVQAGSTHSINACQSKYEGSLLFGKYVTHCLQPANLTMDQNKVFVVYTPQ